MLMIKIVTFFPEQGLNLEEYSKKNKAICTMIVDNSCVVKIRLVDLR